MWTCLTCNAENIDTTEICINCNLEKSLSEQIQIKLSKQKKRAHIVIPIFNAVNSLNLLYLIIFGILFFNKLSFPAIYFGFLLIYVISLIGLWQYKKWGVYLFVGFISLVILSAFLSVFMGNNLFATLFSMISIVVYLNYKRYFS